MAKAAPMGTRGEAEETVEFQHTLTAHHPALPPVYSTPNMIRLMETAAFVALQPFCEGDEITVGTSIHVEHRAASGIGTRVKAVAVVESFDGRYCGPDGGERIEVHGAIEEGGRVEKRAEQFALGKRLAPSS